MKKTRSRLLSLLLAVILIASAIPVQAASSDIAPYRYDYVSSCSIFLNISSRGLATCTSDISLRRGVNAEMTRPRWCLKRVITLCPAITTKQS